jgi:hypothetical protein
VGNRNFGFAIHRTGNISAIYTLKGFVVGIAGSAVIAATVIAGIAGITGVTAVVTGNITLTVVVGSVVR